jgi:hypothetical protein
MRQVQRVLQPAITDLELDWGAHAAQVADVTPAQLRPLFSGDLVTVYAFLPKQVYTKKHGRRDRNSWNWLAE